MKKIPFLVTIFLILLLSCQVAFSYTINDPVGDRIGDWRFEIYGIDVSLNIPNSITFSLFTNYPQSGFTVVSWATFPGDLAIDVNLDGAYEYGFALTTHNSFTAGKLYSVNNSSGNDGWYISNKYAPSSGYTYNKNEIVTIKNGSYVGDATSWGWNPIGTPGPPVGPDYRIDIVLDPSLFAGLDGDIGLHWASATCANDYVSGAAPVPEPATIFLMGSGLLGVGIILRKKVLKSKDR